MLVIPNSPVQFCPFPVYPGWQSHICDPMVLLQFAFSWQESFPLHSSTSIKSEIKKVGFQNYAKIAVHKPLPCLRVQAMVVFNLLLDCKNARLSYMKKTSYLCKKISLNNKQQTSRQTKTKQNEHIQTSERRKQYTRSINYSKKFTFGKI